MLLMIVVFEVSVSSLTSGVVLVSGTSGSFVANRIRVDNNTATVVVENGSIADALIHIQFHPGSFIKTIVPTNTVTTVRY